MAEVFLARGTGAGGIGRFFAIKRILPQYADSPEFIDMFKDEAKIAINLSHSNIVSIHEFGVEKGQFFLVMDYVEGRNLRQILNKMKKSNLQFSVDQIVYMIKEIAAGLDHAHRCIEGTTGKPLNITHRDMSPQNIMVSFEGEMKIVDFGIAKAESQLETTRAGTLKGKFGYMSPEQAEGQPVDLRTDIFSLGIVLWELLAADRLFMANNEINTLRKIRDCQIPPLRKLNPNIHNELERIVQKALARDRNLRYQTGAALHRDLNRFLNRQYPDFSPQDFAVFIKSVFADEILSLRKRLVDYAKVNFANAKPATEEKQFGDRTSLLDSNTNSLIVTEGGASRPKDDTTLPPLDESTRTGATESLSVADGTKTDADRNATTVRPSQSGADVNEFVATGPVLDESALQAEMLNINGRGKRQWEGDEMTSPSYRQRSHRQRTRTNIEFPQTKARPMRMATFVVFAFLCTSVYAYLAKYFPRMMTEVIVKADPYIHTFHEQLGIQVQQLETGSHRPASTTPQAQQTATREEVKPPLPKVPEVVVNTSIALVVTSNPSGAEILVDGVSTGMITPSRIEVPTGKPFDIVIYKRGFDEYRLEKVTAESLGNRLAANLEKSNLAFVNIEVFPPQPVQVSINGKSIPTQRLPIIGHAVPANSTVRVRAENRAANTYDEVVVTLGVDKRQTIQLNPRKPLRAPSGE